MSDTRPTAPLVWRLFVLGGLGTLAVVSIDDDAWETFDDLTGSTVSRKTCRVTLVSALSTHVLEAVSAWRSARRSGVGHPFRWTFSTLLWGAPVLVRLRRVRRSLPAA